MGTFFTLFEGLNTIMPHENLIENKLFLYMFIHRLNTIYASKTTH